MPATSPVRAKLNVAAVGPRPNCCRLAGTRRGGPVALGQAEQYADALLAVQPAATVPQAEASRRRLDFQISPLALEAVCRIDELFEIERAINGQSAERRRAVRQELSAPLVANLEAMYSLIATAKMNDIDPQAWLADVLARIAEHPVQN